MSYREIKDHTPIRITESEVDALKNNRAWLAFCQALRTKQSLILSEIKAEKDMPTRAMLHDRIEIIEEVIEIARRLKKSNIGVDDRDSLAREERVRQQLKGGIV